VGTAEGVNEILALGDAVNTAARLASVAGPGEIVLSEETSIAASQDETGLEVRRLELKGRKEPVDVRVIEVKS
jgi:class 3 adenylate cyclase